MPSTPPITPPVKSTEQQSQISQSTQKKDSGGGGGADAVHGLEFHLHIAMLLVLRLVDLKQSDPKFEYRIWLEKAGYGKFDDIVLQYKKISSKWIQICFQCKSGEEKTASDGLKIVSQVSAQDFLSPKKNSFKLLDFITSFSDIKDNAMYCDSYYVLITNREYSNYKYRKYKFLQREEIDLTSKQIFSDILDGIPFKFKYSPQLEKHILKLNVNIDLNTIKEFCKKFCFVCDKRKLEVEVYKRFMRIHKSKTKTNKCIALFRSLVFDMYQRKAEPSHSDFLNLLNCNYKHYKIQPTHENFTGREEEIKKMRIALLNKKGVDILDLSVTGNAGMGKTQIVRKYIDENIYQFEYIKWINAENKDTLDSSFVELAKTCQLIKKDGNLEIAVVTKDVYTYFREETLFVFDNAGEVLLLQGNPGEYIYLPNHAASNSNRFIVISRSKKWATNYKINVDTFSKKDALLYLDKVIAQCTRVEKQDLAASVQNWPLALCLAASYIKLETDNSLDSKSLSEESHIIDNVNLHTHVLHQLQMKPYNESLESLWQLIEAKLKTKNDLALKILKILSFSSPDNFPIELLKFECCIEDEVLEAIKVLRDNSLVTVGDFNMTIHRALQAVVQNSVTSDRNLLNKFLVDGIKTFENYLIAMNDSDRVKTLGNIHMLTFFKYVRKAHVELQIYVKMSRILYEKLVLSSDVLILCNEGNIFDQILLETGCHLDLYFGENQNMLLTKASMLNKMRKYDMALSIYNDVLPTITWMLGKNHRKTASCMHSKASVLCNMGNHDDALSTYTTVIEVQTKILGKDHSDTLTSMQSKASLLNNMKKYDDALNMYNDMIGMQTEKLGWDHSDTLNSMNNKAKVLYNMEKYEEVQNIYDHEIKVMIEKIDKVKINILNIMHSKASVLDTMGEYDEALSNFNCVTEGRKKRFGKNHPHTLSSMLSKAEVLVKMERYDDVRSICNDVMELETQK